MAQKNFQVNDNSINIIGAGVFGLSTAIDLAKRGYQDITIFDKRTYDSSLYSYFNGCDAASADLNKIFRCAYGAETVYQSLSIEAFEAWKAWNEETANGNAPDGMAPDDRVFVDNGDLSLTDLTSLPPFEIATVQNMAKAGYPQTQLITYNSEDVRIAREKGFAFAIDPFDWRQRGQRFWECSIPWAARYWPTRPAASPCTRLRV